ncbi:hypothetical protein GCM10023084_29210 [Streptomyces lacrimifluminis]|uniref:Tyr recombinase domain-containing protein n=1 Tax=Streptomyces lacrimifluminis TaxID=1500077 RepID=A0A917NU12_9ACTN|nr:hypothetical protein GCM10012282_25840 [Streptomyces lacrimifluminis]
MGLRPAEICDRRWADVHLGRATLIIANTRTLVGNRTVVEKDTKSRAVERQLPLPDPVREALRVVDENGLRRVRLYDARASCFTYLANNGVPHHLLARWAGHTDVRTTKRWYVEPDVEDLRPAADAWGGLASVSTPAPEESVRCGSVSG